MERVRLRANTPTAEIANVDAARTTMMITIVVVAFTMDVGNVVSIGI